MKAVDKYINYLNEIMQDHWQNNKSLYREDGEETFEWKKTDKMNHKIMWMVRDFFDKKKPKPILSTQWIKGYNRFKKEKE